MSWDTAEIRRKVRCSACRGPIRDRVNLVLLRRKATWRFPTAGNVLTGEEGHAVAICCEACIDGKRDVVEAVEFAGDAVVYHSVSELEKLPPLYPDQVELPFGPGRDLKDGRVAYVTDLTFGRGRICIGPARDLSSYDDGY